MNMLGNRFSDFIRQWKSRKPKRHDCEHVRRTRALVSIKKATYLRRNHIGKSRLYYEFLQISPNADPETIHRVYRFLAGRFHPDNPKTGNAEAFFLLKEAYDVLSHPERRAEHDASRQKEAHKVAPLSTSIDFMDSVNGEMNRRLVILGLLYIQRRTNPYQPELSLFEVEARMGFPRD
jgi:curved DNA-binding protein